MTQTRPRDSYWSRVRNAEVEFAAAYSNSTVGQPLSFAEQKAFTTKIAKSAWWRKRRPDVPAFSVVRSRSLVCCDSLMIVQGSYIGQLQLPNEATQLDVLHAAAHFLHGRETAWHGPEYAKAMLDLVGKFIGMDARRALAETYKKHKVKTVQWSQDAKDRAKSRYAERDLKALLDELKSPGEGVTPAS